MAFHNRKFSTTLAFLSAAALLMAGCGTSVSGQAMPGTPVSVEVDPAPITTSGPAPITPTHSVQYTVTADHDTQVMIVYLSTEPTVMPVSKKPPANDLTMLKKPVTVGPNKPWTFSYSLNDPEDWRYVHASITGEVRAELHCLVTVDKSGTDDVKQQNSVSCPDRPSW